jgi:hypothetical protein
MEGHVLQVYKVVVSLDFSNVTSLVGHYGPATAIFPRGRRVRDQGWGAVV